MVARPAAVDKVVSVGIDLHVELLAVLYVGFGDFGEVAEVYVVVRCAVDEQEVSVKVGCTLDGVDGVALWVFGGGAHVALGIDGVVILPIGGCGYGYSCLKDGAPFRHGHERIETSEAPSPDGDVLCIDVGKRGEVKGGFDLVARLEESELEVGAFFKF